MIRVGRWAVLLAASTLAVGALSYAYFRSESRQIRRERYGAIAAVSTLKVEQLQLWRQFRLDHAQALGRAPSVIADLVVRSGRSDADLARARSVINTGIQTYGYAASFVLAADTQPLITAGPAERVAAPDAATVAAALARAGPVMGVFFRGNDGRVYVDTAAAVRDPKGRPLGVVVLRTDAQATLFPMLQTWPIANATAETLLVRRDGDEVVVLNDLRHRPGGALTLREPVAQTDRLSVQAATGGGGSIAAQDYRGTAVLADVQPVSGTDWYLIAKIDAGEVAAEARFRAGIAVAFITLLVVACGAAVASFYRRRQADQFRGLYESLRETEQLRQEAEEAGQLGSFVSDLAAGSWRGSKNLDRVLGIEPDYPHTSAGWLQVVHPAEREELSAYFQAMIASRGHFDREYRIIRPSDRSERWVHCRARGEYDAKGRPLRMVGTVQDITAGRAAAHSRIVEDQRYQRQRNALTQMATGAPPADAAALERAFQQLTEVAARTLDVERVSIWRFTDQKTGIRCLDLYEREASRHSSGLEISTRDNPAYFQALADADILAADDALRDPSTAAFASGYLMPLGITSMMDAVVRLRGVVVGVLCCEHTGPVRRWTYDEQTFAVAVANMVAMSLAGFDDSGAAGARRDAAS